MDRDTCTHFLRANLDNRKRTNNNSCHALAFNLNNWKTKTYHDAIEFYSVAVRFYE